MRTPLVMGNWKMNLDKEGAIALSQDLKDNLSPKHSDSSKIILGVHPPFPFISIVHKSLQNSPFKIGAQNLYFREEGAFTGEVSPKMLKSLECSYVIIGHSERRQIFGETNEAINQKIIVALAFHLTPIVCVGETLEERESGKMKEVITSQLTQALKGLNKGLVSALVLAYEPIWAIGTGVSASPEDAEETHLHIRNVLTSMQDEELAMKVPILYGGSVKPTNAFTLSQKENIDGALVGGASLKGSDFLAIADQVISGKEKK